jgi:hypothetical protein
VANDPAVFLKRAQENPSQLALEIKGNLGELYKKSMVAAHNTKYALKSLLGYYEIPLIINGKIKVRRKRPKLELNWENADKIIAETREPYRSIFTFLKWSGFWKIAS